MQRWSDDREQQNLHDKTKCLKYKLRHPDIIKPRAVPSTLLLKPVSAQGIQQARSPPTARSQATRSKHKAPNFISQTMVANKKTPRRKEQKKPVGIDIIYSAKDSKQVPSSPPKLPENVTTTFPSPPLLRPQGTKISSAEERSLAEPSVQPKPCLPPRATRQVIGRWTCTEELGYYCCHACTATFATETGVLLHQAARHRDVEFLPPPTEKSGGTLAQRLAEDFSQPPTARTATPSAQSLEALSLEQEENSVSRVPRGQGTLWVPPISTRPKLWDGVKRKRKASKKTPPKTENTPQLDRSYPEEESPEEFFRRKIRWLSGRGMCRIPEWLEKLEETIPPEDDDTVLSVDAKFRQE